MTKIVFQGGEIDLSQIPSEKLQKWFKIWLIWVGITIAIPVFGFIAFLYIGFSADKFRDKHSEKNSEFAVRSEMMRSTWDRIQRRTEEHNAKYFDVDNPYESDPKRDTHSEGRPRGQQIAEASDSSQSVPSPFSGDMSPERVNEEGQTSPVQDRDNIQ